MPGELVSSFVIETDGTVSSCVVEKATPFYQDFEAAVGDPLADRMEKITADDEDVAREAPRLAKKLAATPPRRRRPRPRDPRA